MRIPGIGTAWPAALAAAWIIAAGARADDTSSGIQCPPDAAGCLASGLSLFSTPTGAPTGAGLGAPAAPGGLAPGFLLQQFDAPVADAPPEGADEPAEEPTPEAGDHAIGAGLSIGGFNARW